MQCTMGDSCIFSSHQLGNFLHVYGYISVDKQHRKNLICIPVVNCFNFQISITRTGCFGDCLLIYKTVSVIASDRDVLVQINLNYVFTIKK